MDDFDVDDLSPEKLPSAIYNCLECSNKVAHGDKFCRHCGIEFTPVHCEQMIGNLKLVGKDSFWHLVLIVLFVLVIIFGVAILVGAFVYLTSYSSRTNYSWLALRAV